MHQGRKQLQPGHNQHDRAHRLHDDVANILCPVSAPHRCINDHRLPAPAIH